MSLLHSGLVWVGSCTPFVLCLDRQVVRYRPQALSFLPFIVTLTSAFSIRTLCDNLRRERDRAVSELAEVLRSLDDTRKQKNDVSRELKELK